MRAIAPKTPGAGRQAGYTEQPEERPPAEHGDSDPAQEPPQPRAVGGPGNVRETRTGEGQYADTADSPEQSERADSTAPPHTPAPAHNVIGRPRATPDPGLSVISCSSIRTGTTRYT